MVACCFVPRFASAHTLGLSTAAFEADAQTGRVEASFVFATAEALGGSGASGGRGVSLDRDHDGVVTGSDVKAAREDLRAFLADGVEVTGDGARCPPTFTDAALSEVDGLVLTSTYACPRNASSFEAVLYFLSALPRAHREVVRITAGSATAESVLSGEHRAITLRLPPDAEEPLRALHRERTRTRLVVLTAVFTVLMLSLFLWRWRTAPRRPHSASSPPPHSSPAKARKQG
jgi:hypothetical protein